MAEQSKLSEIKDLYELPEGWAWKKLREIALIERNQINPIPNEKYNYVSLAHIETHSGKLLEFNQTKGEEIKSSKVQFSQKHVLYSRLRPYLNKVVVPHFDGICTSELIPLKPRQEVLREYLAWYLRSSKFVNYAIRNSTGTHRPRMKMKALKNTKVPLPPLEEQRRIVVRIEEFATRIEEASRLKRISKERSEKVMQATLQKAFSRNRRDWTWTKLGDVLVEKPQYGLTAKSSRQKKEIRYIRISDITNYGDLRHDDPRFLDLDQDEFEKYKLIEKDILIARSGTVGKIYIHGALNQKAVFASYLIRFKLDTDKIAPKFFFYYGLSPFYKKFIEDTSRVMAQPNINAREYSKLEIPLFPLKEQKEIITHLDNVKGKVKSLRTLQGRTDENIENVASAILDKAFKGQFH